MQIQAGCSSRIPLCTSYRWRNLRKIGFYIRSPMFLTLSGLVARRKDVLHMKHAAAQSHLSCHSEVSRGSHPGSDDQAIGSFTLEKPVSELSGDSKTAAIISRSMVTAGNTEFTQPENRAFYPALDGLRAIAFLMVFGQHYLQIPWGWTGVDLFFVLSGCSSCAQFLCSPNLAHFPLILRNHASDVAGRALCEMAVELALACVACLSWQFRALHPPF